MGSKIAAKRLMAAAGVPVLPGATVARRDDDRRTRRAGRLPDARQGRVRRWWARHAGGHRSGRAGRGGGLGATRGGLGVRRRHRVPRTIRRRDPRHVEVQIFGDAHGNVVHLFERECSIQRRHQKIVEEAPSPAVDDTLRAALGDGSGRGGEGARLRRCRHRRVRPRADGSFFFLEVNTRLQVEHPVTEMITGLDLVRLQLDRRRGQAAAGRGAAGRDRRPRDRGPAVRRGRRRRVPPGQRTGRSSADRCPWASVSTPATPTGRPSRPSTTRCWRR